ncbi:DUF3320 domain-containing protein [Actinoplanes derwentensis]|uniref:DUF3320 domain-containing protein n=1 Tax=Actinoplanes derwentensis TaxID=113562 RepID=UPI001A44DD5F|nr:DUF3320 domain-containing protein [Actinoplanes derwentensis]GID84943.1 hypothetical protein Ade03nite_38670 [Actinoplanes derwentensis]
MTGRPDARVRGVLETWRTGLLDLTATNPLIHVDPDGPGVVAIDSPSPRGVLEALQQGRECGFLGAEEQAEGPRPRAISAFQTPMTDVEMDTTLRSLRRSAHRDQLEYGLSALYLTIGTLHWNDEQREYASPILLLPVDLADTDPHDYPRLRARPDDPLVNPALTVRLKEHGIELPAVESLTGLDVTVFWARLDAAIGEHPEWRTDEAILLSRFTTHREVVYHDLVDNERQILAHPVIRALATEARAQIDAFKFEPIPARSIDDVAPPDDIPLVLDADAGQRACVSAALSGRSFVMRGAPGTGKSQTVANMIAALIHAGKRVLLVSEKAASLDVVKARLTLAGLDDYLLELHSDRTGRDEVATTLAAALDFIPLPPPGLSTDERQELRDHRERLNAYAEAMNEVREPLGHRLHDVLGMCAQMTDVASAPIPPVLPVPLTTQSLQRVRDAADQLGRAWRPALQGDAFLWRDVVDRNRLEARLQQALAALEHLLEAVGKDRLAVAFRTRNLADAIALTTLVGHAARRPAEAADEWLLMDGLEPVARAAEGLLRHLKALNQAEESVKARSGVTWAALPSPAKLPIVPSLAHLAPPPVELLPLTAAQARGLARRFADEADRLEQHQHSLDRVTARLGLPNVIAFSDINRVAAIVDLLNRPEKPEANWFDAAGMAAAHTASRMLQRAVDVVRVAEEKAREHFNEAALAHPVDELAQRFAHVHKGIGKLRSPYRRDKKAAAEIARPDVKRSQAVANLASAAAWKKALHDLDQTEREYARVLGRHWRRLDTDFEAIGRALATADEVMRVTPPEALPAVIERVSAATPNSAIIRIVAEGRKEFERWIAALRPAPEPAPRPQLAAGPVHDAITWLRAHVEPLTAAAELVGAYSAAAGRDFTLAESAAVGLLRETAADAAAALSANNGEYTRVLGTAYRGIQTDVEALATAMAWTSEARRIRVGVDTALTQDQVTALREARPTDRMPARVAEWQAAKDWILRAFAPRRHASLTADLDDHERALELLRALLEDAKGQQEWFEYQAARATLTEHGLEDVIDFCAREDLTVEQILPVLGRALFQSWAGTVIREDDRLPPLDAAARDHLVEEFRLWDTRLQRAAAADVMNAVDEMQPTGAAAAEAALLRTSAAQQGRRLPVQELISRTRHATLAVKPCFLTVPADVSRLVPADLTFDVVIIDEASRVPVPDAITCVYRGSSFVVVGDDRQLTALPTPGGGRSVLELAISCSAFPVLDLGTHYRSRHESLIAFANHTFYQGRLNTFPPAGPAGPDAGVQLFPAVPEDGDDGLASLVAGRVAHHFVTRPERSLGVIAATPGLAAQIEAAVADMVVPPEDDRLHGFFVKDLETVQGDERDVIILAIGADPGGLGGQDGWRRLNVASTRASRRVEVVSTLRARDLPDTEELRPLAGYLDYAARGENALGLDEPRPEAQTPFEDSVRDVIRSWGYRVRSRVGTGAFRIDLAVRASARRNAPFALGIECDGTTYDSAPAARDRDRLRERVLQDLGWRLHRIWGTAWYLDREHEEQRLRAAIEAALAGYPADEQAPELDGSTVPDPAEIEGEVEDEEREPVLVVETEAGYAPVTVLADAHVDGLAHDPADTLADALADVDEDADAYLAGFADVRQEMAPREWSHAFPGAHDEELSWEETPPVWAGAMDLDPDLEPVAAEQAFPAAFDLPAEFDLPVAFGPPAVADSPAEAEQVFSGPPAEAEPMLTEETGVRPAVFERVSRTEPAESAGAVPEVRAAVFEQVNRAEEETRVRPAVFEKVNRGEVARAAVESGNLIHGDIDDEPRVTAAVFERVSRADLARAETARAEAARAATERAEAVRAATERAEAVQAEAKLAEAARAEGARAAQAALAEAALEEAALAETSRVEIARAEAAARAAAEARAEAEEIALADAVRAEADFHAPVTVYGLPDVQPVFVAPVEAPGPARKSTRPRTTRTIRPVKSTVAETTAGETTAAKAPTAPKESTAPKKTTAPRKTAAPKENAAPAKAAALKETNKETTAPKAAGKVEAAAMEVHHGPDEWAHPYQKAQLAPLPAGTGLTDPESRPHLADAIRRIAAVEGPVHVSVVLQRMREAWSIARITKPARTVIDAEIAAQAEKARVTWADEFLGDPGQIVPAVRTRAGGVARKADQVADSELRVALEHLVQDAGAIEVEGLLAATGKLFGWAARRSGELDDRLTGLVADLVGEGMLERRDDGLSAAHDLPDPLALPRHDAAPSRSRKRVRS